LKDRLTAALASKPEPAPATFFDAPAHEDTAKEAKPAKARKTRAKAIPAESQPVQSVDSGVQLQTEIEHPHAAMMRALSRVETGNRDEQPRFGERAAPLRHFGRPSLYNSLGMRSNGPMTFSTHPNEYDELQSREIAAERAEAKEKQERSAWAGLEALGRMLSCVSKNLKPPRRKAS
jgi:hypothetical protein